MAPQGFSVKPEAAAKLSTDLRAVSRSIIYQDGAGETLVDRGDRFRGILGSLGAARVESAMKSFHDDSLQHRQRTVTTLDWASHLLSELARGAVQLDDKFRAHASKLIQDMSFGKPLWGLGDLDEPMRPDQPRVGRDGEVKSE